MIKEGLITLPLTILFIVAFLSLSGLGSGNLNNMYVGGDPANAVYYDETGHALCYVANLSSVGVGEMGSIYNVNGAALWVNSTNVLGIPTAYYFMYYDAAGSQGVLFQDLGRTNAGGVGSISLGTTLGLIALVVGLMALVIVAGLRILGSGISETATTALWLGTGLMALWGVFSALALQLIILVELGPILYLALTLMYCLGIILSVKG